MYYPRDAGGCKEKSRNPERRVGVGRRGRDAVNPRWAGRVFVARSRKGESKPSAGPTPAEYSRGSANGRRPGFEPGNEGSSPSPRNGRATRRATGIGWKPIERYGLAGSTPAPSADRWCLWGNGSARDPVKVEAAGSTPLGHPSLIPVGPMRQVTWPAT